MMLTLQDLSHLVRCTCVCVCVCGFRPKTSASLLVQHFFRFSTLLIRRKLCFPVIYLSNKTLCFCAHDVSCEIPFAGEILLKSHPHLVENLNGQKTKLSEMNFPWRDKHEWLRAYKRLYADDADSKRMGLEDVAVWRARSRVPLSVGSTALFVTAQFSNSSLAERMAISMAIIRMVNGFVDAHQKKEVAQSVRSLSMRIGLPQLLVDLRHEATHNKLPALPTLRLGHSLAMNWLNENYWHPTWKEFFESQNISSITNHTAIYIEIENLIRKGISNNRRKGKTHDFSASVRALCEEAELRFGKKDSKETLRTTFLKVFLDGTIKNAPLLQKESDFDKWNEVLMCLSSLYPWLMSELLIETLNRLRSDTTRESAKCFFKMLALNLVNRRHLWPEMIYETLPKTKMFPCFPVHRILEICASNFNVEDSWPIDIMQSITDTCSVLLDLELGKDEARIVQSMLSSDDAASVTTRLAEMEEKIENNEKVRRRWEYCEDFCPCVLGSQTPGLYDDAVGTVDRDEMEIAEERVVERVKERDERGGAQQQHAVSIGLL